MKTTFLALFACLFFLNFQAQAQDDPYYNNDPYWHNGMMPGAGYMALIPNGHDSLGIFQGATAFFDFYSKSETPYYNGKGPGHIRFYGRLGILNSTNTQSSGKMFMYSFGSAFSFESRIPRWFFVPYFGLELGGMHQPDFKGAFHITPIGGLNLVHTERVTWFVQGGYTYNTKKFQDWSGINLSTGISVSFW